MVGTAGRRCARNRTAPAAFAHPTASRKRWRLQLIEFALA
jgi:hypothetical protein